MAKKIKQKNTLFEKIENFTKKHATLILIASLLISLIFSIVYFSPDVSVGGDDSIYIKNAYDFMQGKSFPGWHGSIYCIVLSAFIFLFGLNIIVLKFVSVAFSLLSIFLIQKILIKISNYTVTAFVVLYTSLSLLLNKYASTTYNEPFFIFLQAYYIYLFVNYITSKIDTKIEWKKMLVFGVLSYLMFQTRSVSIAIVGATIIYLAIEKQYLNSSIYLAFTGLSHLFFSLYKKFIWSVNGSGFENQLETLLQKHPYRPSEGKENFMGFIQRLWDNSELYLSKHLIKMTGFKSIESRETNVILTIALLVSIFLLAFIVIRKNKKSLFIILYLIGIIGLTFISLQKSWDQDRLIIFYFPYIVGIMALGIWYLFQNKSVTRFQFLPFVLFTVLLFSIGKQTIDGISKYSQDNKFISGEFSSYDIDWQNYMKAARWAGLNLSDTSVVVCRKPGMAWISAKGADIFKGVYSIKYYNADSIQKTFEELGATHVIMANLRADPRRKTAKTINTIRKSLEYLTVKSPSSFELLKEFGKDEKAYIFKINLGEKTKNEIIKNMDSDIIISPKSIQHYFTKGSYYFNRKEYKEALKYYQFPLNFKKDSPVIYFNVALCYYGMKDFKNAATNFEEVIKLKETDSDAWYNLSICYLNIQKLPEAKNALITAMKNGLKKDPKQIKALMNAIN